MINQSIRSTYCVEKTVGPAAVADRHFRPTDVGCYDPNFVSEASALCRATCTVYSITNQRSRDIAWHRCICSLLGFI